MSSSSLHSLALLPICFVATAKAGKRSDIEKFHQLPHVMVELDPVAGSLYTHHGCPGKVKTRNLVAPKKSESSARDECQLDPIAGTSYLVAQHTIPVDRARLIASVAVAATTVASTAVITSRRNHLSPPKAELPRRHRQIAVWAGLCAVVLVQKARRARRNARVSKAIEGGQRRSSQTPRCSQTPRRRSQRRSLTQRFKLYDDCEVYNMSSDCEEDQDGVCSACEWPESPTRAANFAGA
mmetsp:Transcript_13650/g.24089  ORF Transcript_13650/g.24089 Transcript_13650/m.24089 type:complete len:239 (+) Transcript_13650:25-741(+)